MVHPSLSIPSSSSPSVIHCRLSHIAPLPPASGAIHATTQPQTEHFRRRSEQVSQTAQELSQVQLPSYAQRAYCDHQPADCCSEHPFSTPCHSSPLQLVLDPQASPDGVLRPLVYLATHCNHARISLTLYCPTIN
jgi:hypothetical protein